MSAKAIATAPFIEEAVLDTVNQEQLKEALLKALDSLSEKQRTVIIARFGLDGNEKQTCREIAAAHGMTLGQVQWAEASALRDLRHPLRARPLEEWL